ncbi:hypothetical protein D3C87_1819690 [compost metagenome]
MLLTLFIDTVLTELARYFTFCSEKPVTTTSFNAVVVSGNEITRLRSLPLTVYSLPVKPTNENTSTSPMRV